MPDNTGIHEFDSQAVRVEPAKSMVEGICDEVLLFPRFADPYPVNINMPVWRQLWQYACDNKDREIGGVLLGSVLQDESGEGLDIQAYLPGRYMEETLANLTFTHKTWIDINQRLLREHNDKRIIGWFHTHPGHGIFMSRYDLYIHQNYFAGEGQVAVVFDPVHSSAGFFQRRDDRMLQLRRIHIYTMAGDAFDQNTRDFIARVGEHSHPQCQPTLGLPSFRIDIQNGPPRELRHQGLAFLVRLMDICKKDKTTGITEEITEATDVNRSMTGAASSIDQPAPGVVSHNDFTAVNEIEDQLMDIEFSEHKKDSSWVAASAPTKADIMGILGENLDLYSDNSGATTAREYLPQGQGAAQENDSDLYTPLARDGIESGPGLDAIAAKSALTGSDHYVKMTRHIDDERIDLVKKKLTPIKDQVTRDLRQAEKEILSPSGNRQPDYRNNKPYQEGFDTDAVNIML
ncbi:MAG: hypothetical protein GXY34_14205 [Syntrophomonadaceae bacterium]|nr:hypothetical protein [Syntrophomonadaceae bacterium]